MGATRRERRLGVSQRRFIADAMLGRLARWLRLLGFDCAWEHDVPDERLVRRALDEKRIILSRDRALPDEWRVSDVYLVEAEVVRDQLAEVVRRFELEPEIQLLTRCSHCNAPLAPAAATEVSGRVPARVLEHASSFSACAGCGQVYWEGTHTQRIRRFVDEVLARR